MLVKRNKQKYKTPLFQISAQQAASPPKKSDKPYLQLMLLMFTSLGKLQPIKKQTYKERKGGKYLANIISIHWEHSSYC